MVMRHLSAALAITTAMAIGPGLALAATPTPTEVLQDWYKMVLELTRHTATMSPPVARIAASRAAFASTLQRSGWIIHLLSEATL